MIQCPNCWEPRAGMSTPCRHCGDGQVRPEEKPRRGGFVWLVLILLLTLALAVWFGIDSGALA